MGWISTRRKCAREGKHLKNGQPRLTDLARVVLALDASKIQYYKASVAGIDNLTKQRMDFIIVQGFVFSEQGAYKFTLKESLAMPTLEIDETQQKN